MAGSRSARRTADDLYRVRRAEYRRRDRGGHPVLGGRNLDAFLLAGICHIADGGALHIALPAQIVEFGSAVHGAAIVPHHEIMHPPAMRVDELPLRRMGDQLIDERAAFRLRHAKDAAGVRGEVKRLSSGFRIGAHHHLRHRG